MSHKNKLKTSKILIKRRIYIKFISDFSILFTFSLSFKRVEAYLNTEVCKKVGLQANSEGSE